MSFYIENDASSNPNDGSHPSSINLGDTHVEMTRNGKKSIFDVSSLTENERIGIFIGATLVVLYLLK